MARRLSRWHLADRTAGAGIFIISRASRRIRVAASADAWSMNVSMVCVAPGSNARSFWWQTITHRGTSSGGAAVGRIFPARWQWELISEYQRAPAVAKAMAGKRGFLLWNETRLN